MKIEVNLVSFLLPIFSYVIVVVVVRVRVYAGGSRYYLSRTTCIPSFPCFPTLVLSKLISSFVCQHQRHAEPSDGAKSAKMLKKKKKKKIRNCVCGLILLFAAIITIS